MSIAAAAGDLLNQGLHGFSKISASKPMAAIRGLSTGSGAYATRARNLGSQLYGGMKSQVLNKGFGAQAGLFAAAGGAAGYYGGDRDLRSTTMGAGLGVLGAVGHRGFRVGRASPLLRSELQNVRSGLQQARTKWGNLDAIKGAWSKSKLRESYMDLRAQGAARRLGATPYDPRQGMPGRLNFDAPAAAAASTGPIQRSLF